jgi:cyanophycinase
MGGGKMTDGIRDRFLELAGGKKARLVVIPTASTYADKPETSSSYLFWRGQSVDSVEVLHTRDRQQANDPVFVEPLSHATGVWLGGGDQSKLAEAYLNTAVLRELFKVLDRGGVIGGTSAGASIMSATMITGGTTKASLGTGFGLMPAMVIDQHFTNRNRMGRLQGILAEHPDVVGLGIDEQTAAVFHGPTLSIVGNASAFVCLSPTQTLPVSIKRMKAGDQLDLNSLSQAWISRTRGTPDKPTAVAGTSGTPRETTPPMMRDTTPVGH